METGLVSKNHYLEYIGNYKAMDFVVLFNSGGYRTAYVNVTNTFCDKLDYFECDNYIDVHCGFTYKDCRLPFEEQDDTGITWLGWDYAHYGDKCEPVKAEEYFGCNEYVLPFSGHLYTLDEVISECKRVIDYIERGVHE